MHVDQASVGHRNAFALDWGLVVYQDACGLVLRHAVHVHARFPARSRSEIRVTFLGLVGRRAVWIFTGGARGTIRHSDRIFLPKGH